MSNPSEEDATLNASEEPTYAERVNQVFSETKVDDKGNLVFAENVDEGMRFAVTAEKRRRDTQAEFTRATQTAKQLEAEKAALLTEATGKVELGLTAEQAEELEELKFSDPEAWRSKMNTYESQAKAKRNAELDEKLKQVSSSTLVQAELEERKNILEAFNEEHSDLPITQDLIDNDIPPRITKKLETGKVTFHEFLTEVYKWAKSGKVVHSEKTMDQPNLSKAGGGNQPGANAKEKDFHLSYKNETY